MAGRGRDGANLDRAGEMIQSRQVVIGSLTGHDSRVMA